MDLLINHGSWVKSLTNNSKKMPLFNFYQNNWFLTFKNPKFYENIFHIKNNFLLLLFTAAISCFVIGFITKNHYNSVKNTMDIHSTCFYSWKVIFTSCLLLIIFLLFFCIMLLLTPKILENICLKATFETHTSLSFSLFSFNRFFYWDSLHARLNSHYEVWSYKKKKYKKIKEYRKSVYKEPT